MLIKDSMNGGKRVSPGQEKRLGGMDGRNHEGKSEKKTKKQNKARAGNEEEKRKPSEDRDAETGAKQRKTRENRLTKGKKTKN
jgi:hypothetical protein